LRLDAVARFLQDVAIDDVQETGWGTPEHLWFVRRIRVDVLRPFLDDREVELTTWCSGVAAIAAGRRWSVAGDGGGRIEVDSVWIHLDAGARPARIEDFGVYADAAGGRRVSTALELHDPPAGAERRPWALRATDVDLHGHVNNAVYWQAVEELLPSLGVDPRQPLRAELEYRQPIDLGEEIGLVPFEHDGGSAVAFVADGGAVRAVSHAEQQHAHVDPRQEQHGGDAPLDERVVLAALVDQRSQPCRARADQSRAEHEGERPGGEREVDPEAPVADPLLLDEREAEAERDERGRREDPHRHRLDLPDEVGECVRVPCALGEQREDGERRAAPDPDHDGDHMGGHVDLLGVRRAPEEDDGAGDEQREQREGQQLAALGTGTTCDGRFHRGVTS
jgi:acyl-ACP thioesterase